ncbi:MAG: transcriptional regulator MraZ [Patescibacteria group bacterium]|nr:transcriptional regulator MraZ [Patescibacteria group bacterium]
MFIGEYHFTLDNKGRIAIPVKLRKELIEGGVLTRGLDNCLFLFAAKDWQQLAEKIKSLPLSQANSRAFSRFMLAGAMEVELDSQGRILIPEYLRKYASLSKKIVLAGVYNRLELWDENNWEIYKQRTEKESGDISERLGDLGI